MDTQRKYFLQLFTITFAISYLLPIEALARGGGGGGGGGGILALILWPFFIAYGAFMTHLVFKKNQEAQRLADRLRQSDSAWNMDKISARVQDTYFKIQEAWMARDQSICRDFVSDKLYSKHKMQTDEMIKQHRTNILQDINLLDTKVVQISDFKDNTRDSLWVWIKGSMIDYIQGDKAGQLISGDKNTPHSFTEFWKFVRQGDNWVLDEIHQTSIGELEGYHSFTEQPSMTGRTHAGRSI